MQTQYSLHGVTSATLTKPMQLELPVGQGKTGVLDAAREFHHDVLFNANFFDSMATVTNQELWGFMPMITGNMGACDVQASRFELVDQFFLNQKIQYAVNRHDW